MEIGSLGEDLAGFVEGAWSCFSPSSVISMLKLSSSSSTSACSVPAPAEAEPFMEGGAEYSLSLTLTANIKFSEFQIFQSFSAVLVSKSVNP